MKILFLFFITLNVHASLFSIESKNELVTKTLYELEALLPKEIKNNFRDIPVRLVALNKNKDLCTEEIRFGYTKRKYIAIAKELFHLQNCTNRNASDLLRKTLVHELSHYIEFNHKKDPLVKDKLFWCSSLSGQEKTFNQKECFYYRKINARPFSSSHEFQNLNFFEKNKLKLRSPDLYEKESSQESFAVNFEYFILDPEFKCRRPTYYRFYQKLFKHSPYEEYQCPNNFDVFLAPPAQKVYQLDPRRVYRIDYFLASEGDQMMSRFGHSMLRIIMCAPTREEINEKCLNDTNHHLVISFRANQSNGLGTSMFKGVFGGYPSQLYIMPLSEIIFEYTRKEKRDLYSFPLNINEEQKIILLERIREIFWSYQGDYYFTSNNCASETRDLLSILIPEKSPFWFKDKADTPFGLKKQLLRYNLIYDSEEPSFHGVTTKNLEEKFENTYFSQFLSYEEYLKTSYQWRRKSFDNLITLDEIIQVKEIEEEILLIKRDELSKEIAEFANKNKDSNIFKLYMKVANNVSRTNPWMLASDMTAYGITVSGLNKKRYLKYSEESKKLLNEIDKIVLEEKNLKRIEIENIQQNINILVKKMIQMKLGSDYLSKR